MSSTRLIHAALLVSWAAPSVAAAAEGAPIVAVFTIEDARPQKVKMPSRDLENLTAYLATRISEDGAYKIVPDAQIRSALADKKKESYQACFDTACQIQIGKEVAAQKSLATRIVPAGNQCVTISTLYDLRESASERSADQKSACDQGSLFAAVESVAAKILGKKAGTGDGPADSKVDADYAALEKDVGKAKQKEAQESAEERRRLERIERAWRVVKALAETRGVDRKKAHAALEKFQRDFGPDNPHESEVEALLKDLAPADPRFEAAMKPLVGRWKCKSTYSNPPVETTSVLVVKPEGDGRTYKVDYRAAASGAFPGFHAALEFSFDPANNQIVEVGTSEGAVAGQYRGAADAPVNGALTFLETATINGRSFTGRSTLSVVGANKLSYRGENETSPGVFAEGSLDVCSR